MKDRAQLGIPFCPATKNGEAGLIRANMVFTGIGAICKGLLDTDRANNSGEGFNTSLYGVTVFVSPAYCERLLMASQKDTCPGGFTLAEIQAVQIY
jgi:hypothetical protein